MKPLMIVPPAQAEALYDAHLDARDGQHLEDRFARLPWVDDDSTEDTDSPNRPVPPRFQERYLIPRKAA